MNQVSVKIPGKVMLAGEYSVLIGGRALAATVKNQMDVVAEPHIDGRCRLDSVLLNDATEFSTKDEANGPFSLFFSSALSGMRRHNISGVSLKVKGNLQPEFGFGSSSALRLGTAVALKSFASGHEEDTYWEEAQEAYRLQKNSQSKASGYDIITQYLGGITLFIPPNEPKETWPGKVTLFPSSATDRLNQMVHVFTGGKGAPTTTTITSTLNWLQEQNLMSTLHATSEKLINAFRDALHCSASTPNLHQLINAVAEHRTIFADSPLFPKKLLNALKKIERFDQNFSFKTTGAGGEDSVLLIGYLDQIQKAKDVLLKHSWSMLDRPFSEDGLKVECISLNRSDLS